MNYREFIDSLELNKCPDQLDPCLQALWHEANGDWRTAHDIVQQRDDVISARIHAYLHRKQGDDWNSRYWHRQAGTRYPEQLTLRQEWESLVSLLVES